MWPFKKKRKTVPYIPKGRVGYRRAGQNFPYYFTVVVEEIGRVAGRSKIRILEVDIDRDCDRTKEQCLKKWGLGDWVSTDYIHWENDYQRAERLGQETPITYEVEEEELEEETQYILTPHNFTQQ